MSSDLRSGGLLAAAAAIWTIAACHGGSADPAPVPVSLSPAIGSTTTDTPVAILGDRFPVKAMQAASGPQGDTVDATYRAWLGHAELQGVRWVDAGRLEGTVPAGLAPGVYRLRVAGPYGLEAQLDAAFTVAPGPVPAPDPDPGPVPASSPTLTVVSASPSSSDVHVGERFTVRVAVRNDGGSSAASVAARVAVSGSGGAVPDGAVTPQDLAAGATAVYAVPYLATAAGTLVFSAAAAGTDPMTGLEVSAPPVTAQLAVEGADSGARPATPSFLVE